jgi:hypothetical protein
MHFSFHMRKDHGPALEPWSVLNATSMQSPVMALSMFVRVPIQLHTIVGVFHNCAQNQVTFKPLTTVTSQKDCKTTWQHLSWDCDISSVDYACIAQFKSLSLGAPAVSTIFASQGSRSAGTIICHLAFKLNMRLTRLPPLHSSFSLITSQRFSPNRWLNASNVYRFLFEKSPWETCPHLMKSLWKGIIITSNINQTK